MARKKKQSPLEDIVELTAMLPWWVGVILALIAYPLLHHYASANVATVTSVAQLGASVTGQIGKTLAMLGQYLLPLAFLIGAGMSAYGRKSRDSLIAKVQTSSSTSVLNDMNWQVFEMLVGEAFRRRGYTVTENGGGGADGGVDLVLRKDNEKYFVQCKQWKAYKVGVSIIRELYGVMAAEGAVGGFVVTSGVFTQEAKSFALGRNIELIDGPDLKELIDETQQAQSGLRLRVPQHAEQSSSPSCPSCGSNMVKRIAKKGTNSGKAFWGCSNYPRCHGIVSIN
jgi:restriction system protein